MYAPRRQTRRRSFSGGPSNVSPPQSDGKFGRDGFTDKNSSGNGNQSRLGPETDSGSMGMPSSYPISAREPHPLLARDYFGTNSTSLPPPGPPPLAPATYSNSYENSPVLDDQKDLDDDFGSRGRTLSSGGGGDFGQPGFLPPPPPFPRRRVTIKFRLKGMNHPGISLSEALDSVPLSQENAYMMYDIARDMHCKIKLRVKWSGYSSYSKMYSIQLLGQLSDDFRSHVDVQSLARRTARAIVHFMQSNNIDLSWDRVVIKRLEETSPGTWIPVTVYNPGLEA